MSDNPKTSLLASADTRTLGPWRVRVGFTSRAAGNLGLHVDDELGGGMDASLVRTSTTVPRWRRRWVPSRSST